MHGDKRVKQRICDVKDENRSLIARLFPSVVKDGEIDFEELKSALGISEEFVGAEKERYELTWSGKKEAKRVAMADVASKTLNYIPQDSKNAKTTENIYIEGDNLEALKLIRNNYYSSIKMIYIDPPYNTGSDFVYNDRFEMDRDAATLADGNRSIDGEKYSLNPSSSNRYHANWLNMIYPRLKVARDLLTDDGVILISIDDCEVHNMRCVANEIFGDDSFIAEFPRVTKRGGKSTATFAKNHDYVLVYCKNPSMVNITGIPHIDEGFKHKDEFYDLRGPYKLNQTLDYNSLQYSETMDYPLEIEGICYVPGGDMEQHNLRHQGQHGIHDWVWRWSKQKFDFGLDNGWIVISNSGRIYTKTYLNASIEKNSDGTYYIAYNDRTKAVSTLETTDNQFSNDNSAKEFQSLMGKSLFEYVKPTSLIDLFIKTCCDKDSIIMDFFSGSGTTAHAVMKANEADSGKRKFIMIQLPEKTTDESEARKAGYESICDIAKERIRRAGDLILKNNSNSNIDVGFKVFRVEDTNIKWNSLISGGQLDFTQIESSPDLTDFMPGAKDIDIVYEIMLRQRDVPLSEKVEKLDDIGGRTFLYADAYLICLESELTTEMIDKMAAVDPVPVKYVFRDSAFRDDIALKDETFRRLKAVIEKNTHQAKQSYTVEFI